MKIFLSTLFALMFAGFSLVAQTSEASATKRELSAGKSSGVFLIKLPDGLKLADVERNAKYYVHYFSVDFNEGTAIATIKMVQNDDKSRHVIIRFLSACGVEKVNVDGTLLEFDTFYTQYLQ